MHFSKNIKEGFDFIFGFTLFLLYIALFAFCVWDNWQELTTPTTEIILPPWQSVCRFLAVMLWPVPAVPIIIIVNILIWKVVCKIFGLYKCQDCNSSGLVPCTCGGGGINPREEHRGCYCPGFCWGACGCGEPITFTDPCPHCGYSGKIHCSNCDGAGWIK